MLLVTGFFAFLKTHLTAYFADRERSHVDFSSRFFLSHHFSAWIS
jgi:hypothetical protein